MLGVPAEVDLHEVPFRLRRGDVLVLLTEGVTGARPGRGGELFGEERLLRTVGAVPRPDTAEIVDTVLDAVTQHSRTMLVDDVAVMVVRVPPPGL